MAFKSCLVDALTWKRVAQHLGVEFDYATKLGNGPVVGTIPKHVRVHAAAIVSWTWVRHGAWATAERIGLDVRPFCCP